MEWMIGLGIVGLPIIIFSVAWLFSYRLEIKVLNRIEGIVASIERVERNDKIANVCLLERIERLEKWKSEQGKKAGEIQLNPIAVDDKIKELEQRSDRTEVLINEFSWIADKLKPQKAGKTGKRRKP